MSFCVLSPAQAIALVTLSSGDSSRKQRHRQAAQVVPPRPPFHRCSGPCVWRLPKVLFQALTVRYSVSFGLASRVCICALPRDSLQILDEKSPFCKQKELERAGSGSKQNKTEHAIPRAAGHLQPLVRRVMLMAPCSLNSLSQSLVVTWSNEALKSYISFI